MPRSLNATQHVSHLHLCSALPPCLCSALILAHSFNFCCTLSILRLLSHNPNMIRSSLPGSLPGPDSQCSILHSATADAVESLPCSLAGCRVRPATFQGFACVCLFHHAWPQSVVCAPQTPGFHCTHALYSAVLACAFLPVRDPWLTLRLIHAVIICIICQHAYTLGLA